MNTLDDGIDLRLKTILQAVADRYGWEIDTMEVMPDHVHLFVSFPPTISIAEAVQAFKGVSARQLNLEFPKWRKESGERHSGLMDILHPQSMTKPPAK